MADFEFQGLDDVLANLSSWGDRVVDAADGAVAEAAAEGADMVRDVAPIDTGALRSSVTHDHRGWGLAVVAVGGPAAPHARAIETRTAFFNRTMRVVNDGLLDTVAAAIIRKAF